MDWRRYVELDPEILSGKPVVKGTRLAVEHVMDLLAAGVPEAEILANHPRLTSEAIRACIAYAAEALKSERVFPLSA